MNLKIVHTKDGRTLYKDLDTGHWVNKKNVPSDVTAKYDSKIGKRVTIKSKDSYMNGEWGIVTAIDRDGTYHVAPYGSDKESLVFDKKELKFNSSDVRDPEKDEQIAKAKEVADRLNDVKKPKKYDDYDKKAVDTLIVQGPDGKMHIERYKGQDLDTYPHFAEVNHDKLVGIKSNGGKWNEAAMNGIAIKDIYDYLGKEFNFNDGKPLELKEDKFTYTRDAKLKPWSDAEERRTAETSKMIDKYNRAGGGWNEYYETDADYDDVFTTELGSEYGYDDNWPSEASITKQWFTYVQSWDENDQHVKKGGKVTGSTHYTVGINGEILNEDVLGYKTLADAKHALDLELDRIKQYEAWRKKRKQ